MVGDHGAVDDKRSGHRGNPRSGRPAAAAHPDPTWRDTDEPGCDHGHFEEHAVTSGDRAASPLATRRRLRRNPRRLGLPLGRHGLSRTQPLNPESRWNSAWQLRFTGHVTVGTGQRVQQPHLVVIRRDGRRLCARSGMATSLRQAHWVPEAHPPRARCSVRMAGRRPDQ